MSSFDTMLHGQFTHILEQKGDPLSLEAVRRIRLLERDNYRLRCAMCLQQDIGKILIAAREPLQWLMRQGSVNVDTAIATLEAELTGGRREK